MSKWIVPVVLIGVLLTVGVWFGLTFIGVFNQDVGIHNQFNAQTKANGVIYDKVWKTIQQKAGVADQYADKFKEIYSNIMDSRYQNNDNLLVQFITESNLTFDASLYKDISLSIEANRAEFARVQQQLIDIDRVHNDLIGKVPTNFFLMLKGDKPFEVKLVTSTRTEKAFETGKDDEVNLFNNKPTEQKAERPQSINTNNSANIDKLKGLPVMVVPATTTTK